MPNNSLPASRIGLIQALGSMGRSMATQVEDFYPLMREAIAEARAAGLESLANSMESRSFAAYTTSSELLGDTGQAIVEFLQAGNAKVPPTVAAKLKECLRQVQRVWPEIRV